jgi:hypothetical protein
MQSTSVSLEGAEVLKGFELGIEWLHLAESVSVTGIAEPKSDSILAGSVRANAPTGGVRV